MSWRIQNTPKFVSASFLKKLSSEDFSAPKKLSQKIFGTEKSPAANFIRKWAGTKVECVLKNLRHLWTHCVIYFIHLHKYLWDNWHWSWTILKFFSSNISGIKILLVVYFFYQNHGTFTEFKLKQKRVSMTKKGKNFPPAPFIRHVVLSNSDYSCLI